MGIITVAILLWHAWVLMVHQWLLHPWLISNTIRSHTIRLQLMRWWKIVGLSVHSWAHTELIHAVLLPILRDWIAIVIKLTCCRMLAMTWHVAVRWPTIHSCQGLMREVLRCPILVVLICWHSKVGSWIHWVSHSRWVTTWSRLHYWLICTWETCRWWLTTISVISRCPSLRSIVKLNRPRQDELTLHLSNCSLGLIRWTEAEEPIAFGLSGLHINYDFSFVHRWIFLGEMRH